MQNAKHKSAGAVFPVQVKRHGKLRILTLLLAYLFSSSLVTPNCKWMICCIFTPLCVLSVFQKFQNIEESHIVHMKDIIQSYAQSVDETHVQIGEVSHTHTHTYIHPHTHTFLWVGWGLCPVPLLSGFTVCQMN